VLKKVSAESDTISNRFSEHMEYIPNEEYMLLQTRHRVILTYLQYNTVSHSLKISTITFSTKLKHVTMNYSHNDTNLHQLLR